MTVWRVTWQALDDGYTRTERIFTPSACDAIKKTIRTLAVCYNWKRKRDYQIIAVTLEN